MQHVSDTGFLLLLLLQGIEREYPDAWKELDRFTGDGTPVSLRDLYTAYRCRQKRATAAHKTWERGLVSMATAQAALYGITVEEQTVNMAYKRDFEVRLAKAGIKATCSVQYLARQHKADPLGWCKLLQIKLDSHTKGGGTAFMKVVEALRKDYPEHVTSQELLRRWVDLRAAYLKSEGKKPMAVAALSFPDKAAINQAAKKRKASQLEEHAHA